MSHGNNTGPGPASAAYTTCGHTDAFLELLPRIAGGALVGHVDTTPDHLDRPQPRRLRAWRLPITASPTATRTPDALYRRQHRLVDSMLPIDATGPSLANPHEVNYHLWTAAGDADVHGGTSSDVAQTFHLHERATNYPSSTVVQGTGHGWFHDQGDGPCSPGPARSTRPARTWSSSA